MSMINALGAFDVARGLGQSIYGIVGAAKNKRPDNPIYRTPEEVNQNVALAKRMASQRGLPGQERMADTLAASTAGAVGAAKKAGSTGADLLGFLNESYQNELSGMNQLAVGASNAFMQNQQFLSQALQTKADFTDKEFVYNKWIPYEQDYQKYRDMDKHFRESIFGGLENVSTGGFNWLQGRQNQSMINRFLGQPSPGSGGR